MDGEHRNHHEACAPHEFRLGYDRIWWMRMGAAYPR